MLAKGTSWGPTPAGWGAMQEGRLPARRRHL